MKNKKGFTILEVLTVIVIITIIMLISFPFVNSLMKKNSDDLYHSYEDMIVEYVIVSPYKEEASVNIKFLEGLDQVKEECVGYVKYDESIYSHKAYIKCGDKYTTSGYREADLNVG